MEHIEQYIEHIEQLEHIEQPITHTLTIIYRANRTNRTT